MMLPTMPRPRRLAKLHIRFTQSRHDLAWMLATLENVTLVEFLKNAVPEMAFDRLTDHYRDVVALSRLIVRHTAIETLRDPRFSAPLGLPVMSDFLNRSKDIHADNPDQVSALVERSDPWSQRFLGGRRWAQAVVPPRF